MYLCINPTVLSIKLKDWLKYQILREGFLEEKIPNTLYNVSIEKLVTYLQVKIQGPIISL